jgi:hypothetical protein
MGMLYNIKGYPPESRIRVWDVDAERELVLRFNGEKVDFYDTIMASDPAFGAVFHITWMTESTDWKIWDEAAILKIDEQLHYNFNFDGYEVEVECVSGYGEPCSEGGSWELSIVGRKNEEDEAEL